MPHRCSAIILAGGLNSRMKGQNKAFLKVGSKLILDRLLEVLKGLFPEILLVTRHPDAYAIPGVTVVTDIFDIRSSLTGIHAGLVHARAKHAFFTACDMPLVKKKMIALLLAQIKLGADAIVPTHGGHLEPLCAIYSKKCLLSIEKQLRKKELRIAKIFEDASVKLVSEMRLREVDPALSSFVNLNTPEDLRAMRASFYRQSAFNDIKKDTNTLPIFLESPMDQVGYSQLIPVPSG